LFLGLAGRLEVYLDEEAETLLEDCPEYTWCIRTNMYLNYL
jgi:hypothetical protein